MTVPTAHKILIGTAIAFFAFFALWELRDYAAGSGDPLALVWSVAAVGGALAFSAYLRRYVRSLERS